MKSCRPEKVVLPSLSSVLSTLARQYSLPFGYPPRIQTSPWMISRQLTKAASNQRIDLVGFPGWLDGIRYQFPGQALLEVSRGRACYFGRAPGS